MSVFQEYAKFYNDLYRDKDYAAECSFLADVFSTFSAEPVKTILDLGCGTGGHALLDVSGFSCLQICPFMKLGRECTTDDWNVSVIAIAR